MPSGRTHDAFTLLLAVPSYLAAFSLMGSYSAAGVATAAFLFGGLIFGPDLDTVSRQYSRWGPFRYLWYPYRSFFSHRSRLSHGILLGALIRVIYFMGVTTLIAYLGAFVYSSISGGSLASLAAVARLWQPIGESTRAWLGDRFLLMLFVGLWAGAASHTLTDMAGTFVKTGRRSRFF